MQVFMVAPPTRKHIYPLNYFACSSFFPSSFPPPSFPSSLSFFFLPSPSYHPLYLETESYSVVQMGLQFEILLPQSPWLRITGKRKRHYPIYSFLFFIRRDAGRQRNIFQLLYDFHLPTIQLLREGGRSNRRSFLAN